MAKKIFASYEEARKIAQNNGISSIAKYKKVYKSLGLPSNPYIFYKDKGWTTWYDFVGKSAPPKYSYEEARKIVQDNGISSIAKYKKVCKSLGLPSNPYIFYKDKGWTTWYDFLGTTRPTPSSERTTKILTTLSNSPVLLEDAPLQIIYMVASQIDKKLAKKIEEMLNTTSCEDRLELAKEQLKNLKSDTTSTSKITSLIETDESSAMKSVMDVFGDSLDKLSEYVSADINNFLNNYYHNAINRELIADETDSTYYREVKTG